MKGIICSVLLTLALGAVFITGLASAADISGVVSAEGGGGLEGVQIRVLDSGGSIFNQCLSDATGAYVFTGLPAGSYVLWTSNEQGYVDELYDNIQCAGGCYYFEGTQVSISAGNDASGIDFALTPGGRISGTITASNGGAFIEDVDVRIYNEEGDSITTATTSADGSYLSPTGLPSGNYFVRTANSQGFFDEIWDNRACTGACDPTTGDAVSVTIGATTSDIDFSLDSGGGISGHITSSGDGAPIDRVRIDFYDAAGAWVSSATPDAAGAYTSSTGLAPGDYFAKTDNWWGHIDELYDDIPCAAGCTVTNGTPIVVAGGITTGIDFALDPGGWISGTITEGTTSLPIEDAGVEVFTVSGQRVTTAFPDSNGVYWASGLPTGDYYLRAYSWENYLAELYDNFPCPDSCDLSAGTAVSVLQPAITSGIDFVLDSGGNLRGTVHESSSGAPVSEAEVQIFDLDGMPVLDTFVDSFGAFDSGPIPSGQYYLFIDAWDEDLVDEVWDDIQCADFCDPEVGTLINLDAGETVDLPILLGSGASLKITVTAEDLTAIPDCEIDLYDAGGIFTAVAFSDETGLALAKGLPEGFYYVRTRNGGDFVDELWEEVDCPGDCDPMAGTALHLLPGGTSTEIDFFLNSARIFSDGFENATTDEWSGTHS